jgi:transcriptional antiterminator RfaH
MGAKPQSAAASDWYVAAAIPRKEHFAIANLDNQGFKTFFPTLPKSSGKPQHGRTATQPLFPGYLFINFGLGHGRWQSINGTLGIRGLVGPHGARPSPVPTRIMADLLARCPEGVWQAADCAFQPGDSLEVRLGAFAGATAKFEEMLSQERVRVLLHWLNTEVSVVMPTTYVGAAA